jgi:hypothetical protein
MLTGRSVTQRARSPCTTVGISAPWSSSPSNDLRITRTWAVHAWPVCPQVSKHVRLSASDRELPMMTALLGTRRARDLLIRRYLCGHPDPFRSVRDLGLVPPGCPRASGVSRGCSSTWLPAWLPRPDRDADDPPLRRSVCAAGQPACPQVSRCSRLSGSDRKFPALTGRSGTQRARQPLRPEPRRRWVLGPSA